MESNQIKQFVLGWMNDHGFSDCNDEPEVGNCKIEDDFGADSLDRVELAIDVEKEFGVEIPDHLVEDWGGMTLDDLVNQIKNYADGIG